MIHLSTRLIMHLLLPWNSFIATIIVLMALIKVNSETRDNKLLTKKIQQSDLIEHPQLFPKRNFLITPLATKPNHYEEPISPYM